MGEGLSFESIARCVARILIKDGEPEADDACRRFERNIGWDRHKLLKCAHEMAAASKGHALLGDNGDSIQDAIDADNGGRP